MRAPVHGRWDRYKHHLQIRGRVPKIRTLCWGNSGREFEDRQVAINPDSEAAWVERLTESRCLGQIQWHWARLLGFREKTLTE